MQHDGWLPGEAAADYVFFFSLSTLSEITMSLRVSKLEMVRVLEVMLSVSA